MTTPNFGWPLIQPTDFVTDLPADFEAFADAVDADLDGLNGGTAGQVLTKASATDYDFAFADPAAGGGMTLLSTTAITAVSSISITSIDQTYNELVIVIANAATSATSAVLRLTANTTASGGPYSSGFTAVSALDSSRVANSVKLNSGATNPIGQTANVNNITGVIRIPRYTDVTPVKIMSYSLAYLDQVGTFSVIFGAAATREAAAIQSLQFFPESGNWTAQGNIHIYGVK
jgi:hypothetical protein